MAALAVIEQHPKLALGTGSFFEEHPTASWEELIEWGLRFTPYGLELAAMEKDRFERLLVYQPELPRLSEVNLSLHAPTLVDDLEAYIPELTALAPNFERIIVHPFLIKNPGLWSGFGGQLLIENMDPFKYGRSPEELEPYFEALPEAGFCLDLQHILAHDRSMHLGFELLEAFGERLAQFHISGVGPRARHLPLGEEEASLFRPFLKYQDIPWVLESLVKGWV